MRKSTSVIVGVASATAIGASWAAGLAPKHDSVGGVTLSAPPPVGSSATGAPRSGSRPKPAANLPRRAHAGPSSTPSGTPKASSRTVDGGVAHTEFGDVQVRITVVGHRMTDVTALHLTDSSRHSVRISAQAAPVLRSEALDKQSAQIDMVSGATYTSDAYRQSLQSAIDAAHLA
ncbi:FMN-binding protein [Terrabacter sp. 2RAF25]|uniref:FMN-binding protein n=1 Tax=Terrabacter sp. 2RAF25 TaxID=3232998 RepID=UPI003F9DA44F